MEELLVRQPQPLPRQGRPGTTAGVELVFLIRNLAALKPLQRSLARTSVCGHLSHIPFGPQRLRATPFCARRSRLRFGIRAVPTSHSGRSTVFLPPFKAAVWQASKLINAPLQIPQAFWAARCGTCCSHSQFGSPQTFIEWALAMVLPTPFK